MPRLEPERQERPPKVNYITAAELIGVSLGILLRWLRAGEFPGEKVRTSWHVSLKDIADELGTNEENAEED